MSDEFADVVDFISHFRTEYGFMPSTREIRDGLGYPSLHSIQTTLYAMEDEGFIAWGYTDAGRRKHRSLRIV